jgi:hypothetical protein
MSGGQTAKAERRRGKEGHKDGMARNTLMSMDLVVVQARKIEYYFH